MSIRTDPVLSIFAKIGAINVTGPSLNTEEGDGAVLQISTVLQVG